MTCNFRHDRSGTNDARKLESSRPMRRSQLFRWIRRTTAALLLIIAIPIMAAAKDRQLKLVSTAWSPFTNAPGQPRFALDLVDVALKRIGV